MTTMGKLGWLVSLVLAVLLAAGAWLVIVPGAAVPASDGRTAIQLSEGERDKVLGEMRGLLETAQVIIEASLADDMATVETAARAAGMVAAEGESPALIAKLPLEFSKLGFATHRAMDDLADLAATNPGKDAVLGALADTMLNCTACHASYRLEAVAE
jgi:cytochrome c556